MMTLAGRQAKRRWRYGGTPSDDDVDAAAVALLQASCFSLPALLIQYNRSQRDAKRESISALKRKMGCTDVYTYTALSRAAKVVEWLGKTDAMTMIYRRGHLSSKTRAHSRAVTRCSPRAHNTMGAISRCIYVQTCKMEWRKSLKYYMEGKVRAAPGKSKKKTRHKGLDIQAVSNLFHELPDARWWWRRRRSYIGEKQQLARKGENHVAEALRAVWGSSLSLSLSIYVCMNFKKESGSNSNSLQ
uniref:Uncharacterized protein n=1 Tax=Trichogramma kaykai TaxID=54128 RepID=A0ABD2VV72_9HYME